MLCVISLKALMYCYKRLEILKFSMAAAISYQACDVISALARQKKDGEFKESKTQHSISPFF